MSVGLICIQGRRILGLHVDGSAQLGERLSASAQVGVLFCKGLGVDVALQGSVVDVST